MATIRVEGAILCLLSQNGRQSAQPVGLMGGESNSNGTNTRGRSVIPLLPQKQQYFVSLVGLYVKLRGSQA